MKDKLLVLMGPTAVGKTSISIELAKRLNGEIISADSMQIYKYMDIGTAKIKKDEKEDIIHHMIDIVYPDEDYSVQNFQNRTKHLIGEINSRNKLPILVGGTGLYINSLVYKLNFAGVAKDQGIRDKYEKMAFEYGNKYLHDKLYEIDKESYEKINIRDLKRIIRALEIYELTGNTMSEYNKNFRKENDEYDLEMFCLNMNRRRLYERINLRVDQMIQEGLIDEVKQILNMGYDKNLTSLKGIGYKEIIMYLEDKISLEEAIEIIKKGSRNYAKRQLTWFRRDKRIKWLDIEIFKSADKIINYIQEQLK
jgi:tRNA dimethylallyltransferase